MRGLEDDERDSYDAVFYQAMRENILRYLDQSGHLARLERAGMAFKENVVSDAHGKVNRDLPSFIYTLQLDLHQIAEISDELCLLFLERPVLARQLVQEVVHCSVATLCVLPIVTPDQVQVELRVCSLPAEEGLRTDGKLRPDPASRRLLLLQGVAVAFTTPTKYTRSAVFRCPNLACPGATGSRFWGPTTSQRRCRFCAGIADEATRNRDVGEQMLVVTVHPDALRSTEGAVVGHPTYIRLCDDLARQESLQLGCRYDIFVLTAAPGGVAEAWGMRPWQDSAMCRVERGLRSDPLPAAIQALWIESSADSESPWAFAVSLASRLGAGLYPAHVFLHLKLGILLSLASQALDHPPVPLLAVGADPAGQALLSRCARLADRGLSVTTATDFAKLPAAPSGAGRGATWLSAGPLVLARGGVCLLGWWGKWHRSSAALSITSALESGKAVIESRDLAGTQLPSAGPSVPLQCAVWTYWTPGRGTKTSEVLKLRTLLNTLGAPVLADASEREIMDICELRLTTAMRERQLTVNMDKEMSEFLSLVNAQPVAITDDASRLIQDYFVASRRVRPNCLPVTAVCTMAAMAEALARLSLRAEATWADVILVVWMYETAFTTLFGPCLISPLPEICSQPLTAENITTQMDSTLDSMKLWLESFTRSVLLSSLRV